MEVHNRTTTSRLEWKFFVVISTNDDVFGLNFCSLFSVLVCSLLLPLSLTQLKMLVLTNNKNIFQF
ncbi:hypothetical protein WN944_024275 [Citrus x changshan-huyou]|uniref:Uncharacterized protein n=1 Tax=Citrus x changshan-huyou TaxID=2935761 RepID=A0AAP0LQB7_9ROSI